MCVLDIERVLYGDRVTHIIIADSSIESRIREAVVVDFVPFLSFPIVEGGVSEGPHLIAGTDP